MKKHPTFLMLITFFAITLFCPASSKADTMAHAIWGAGVQIGWAEMGAYQGAAPSTLVQSLAYARDMARQTGCLPPDQIERLRAAMSRTRDSRTLYQSINSYRQSAHTSLQNCRYAEAEMLPGLYRGLGVQIGWAEMASYYRVDSSTVLQALTSARDHARQISSCINTRNLDLLINAMSQAGNSRLLYQQITSYRQGTLLAEVKQNCSCGASSAGRNRAGMFPGDGGTRPEDLRKTSLNFVRHNDGSYFVTEEGLARVRGPASFDSQTITWRFTYNNREHTSVWRLNNNCTASVSGTHGGTPSTLTRQ